MSRPRTKPSLAALLILAAAIGLWVFDTVRDAAPAVAEKRQGSSPYEAFHGCTLVPDRGNDGDSFRVNLPGGRTEIIRLHFVDAPESAFKSYGGGRNNHRRIAGQAGDLDITPQQAVEIGKRAMAFTLAALEKAPFTLHTAWDDPFGDRRFHGFIEIGHGGRKRFLHELLVENGLARIHTKGAPLPDGTPERKQKDRLLKLQAAAQAKDAGAWSL